MASAEVGAVVTVAVLEGLASVDVTGITKGCGFSGWMKKHNYAGQRATRGKEGARHPGGTSAGTYPGRVRKGKKGAGQYGNDRVTMRNLKVYAWMAKKLAVGAGCDPGAEWRLCHYSRNQQTRLKGKRA